MLEWHEYIEQLLQKKVSLFDGITLSFEKEQKIAEIPPLIKSSIHILDRIIERQGKYNVIVFPERVQSIFVFTIMKLLHNIVNGQIEKYYDPSLFPIGTKLKFGNAIMEFIGIEERNGELCVKVRMADIVSYSAPLDFLPFFQRVNTQKPLSKWHKYVEACEKNEEAQKALLSPEERQLVALADYKTHMESSIFFMTSIISTKEAIANCCLCGKKVRDILLIGQTDYTGTVKNIGSGQLAGIPSVVLASDMYSILAAANMGHPIQSIIIDISDSTRILNQLDVLDELRRLCVPITCVTDIVNSFDLQAFEKREFNIWRWDKSSITDKLYDASTLSLDRKTKHCATQKVEYCKVDGYEISDVVRKLSSHRNESKEQSVQMMRIFDNLNSLAFTVLRETLKLNNKEIERAHILLNDCLRTLEDEKPFLPPDTYDDYKESLNGLAKIYSPGYQRLKQSALAACLQKKNYKSVCIVVPEQSDKKQVQYYWQNWCREKKLSTIISVLHPTEYYLISCKQFSVTIVVGWLKRAIMRKILYGFNTLQYIVLLYDYECRWKNHDTNKWNSALTRSDNKIIINKSLCNDKLTISTNRFSDVFTPKSAEAPVVDELNEIELILRENKFRQYVAKGETKSINETAEAIPVTYVGGFLAFYRNGHKVISATKIITQDAEKIDTILPDQLQVGDFVVVRETDRDLIKEMADIMLENSGKLKLREMAMKWKEALKIELLFSTPEEIYKKLVDAGCTKGYPTICSWLWDEDVIAPQQKQDLQYIAMITENSVIKELFEEIFAAAQDVRSAHIQAGKVLSEQLRSLIVTALNNYGDIDPFNIWEPIEMTVDGIGMVRVLKVIDVGSPVIVDIADTNHLISDGGDK